MGHWTLESINWDRFDPSRVDPEIVRNIKAAAMVERNGDDYGVYLRRVFADDPDFIENVRTLFNNDQDNSSGLGVGTDREFFETFEGKLINAKGVKARYVRTYSKGSSESALNEYTEVEVYGRLAP